MEVAALDRDVTEDINTFLDRLKKERKCLLLVWRINKSKLEKVKEEEVGIFYRGDCYVILCGVGQDSFHIYFWLGSECSQDEQGYAAIMSVELDDYLGGKALQSREAEGYETAGFKKLFEKRIIKSGGYASGFRKVERKDPTLFHVKGRHQPVVTQVECKTSSLLHGDCFILDAVDKYGRMFVLHGKKCSDKEAITAVQMAKKIYDIPPLVLGEDNLNNCGEEEVKILKRALGVSLSREVKFEGVDRVSDEEYEEENFSGMELLRVHDDSYVQVPVEQSSLDSGDCFVLRTPKRVYIWKGRNSSSEEKSNALHRAQQFIRDTGMSKNTQIITVPEYLEPVEFKACFLNWRERGETTQSQIDFSAPHPGNVARPVNTIIDFRKLYHKEKPKEIDEILEDDLDEGNGKTTIYHIVDTDFGPDKEEVPNTNDFVFNSGDCYLIVYRYRSKAAGGRKEKAIIYYWLGNDSDQNEQGKAALVAVNIDDTVFHGEALQIRVTEAKEPPHFMKIFNGYIMIKQPHFNDEGPRLFHVRGKQGKIKVIEVAVDASNLDTNDCFILKTGGGGKRKSKAYVWLGTGSLFDEQEIAHEAAKSICRGDKCDILKIQEGKTEPNEFWEALGGKKPYQTAVRKDDASPQEKAAREARLFHCYNVTGSLQVEEVYRFDQDDLESDDVYVLDCYTRIYLWIGKECRPDEKKMVIKNLPQFIDSDPTARSAKDVQIITVRQGFEPDAFKYHFGAWEDHRVQKMSLEEMKRLSVKENKEICASKLVNSRRPQHSYSYAVLTQEELPEDVDVEMKEMYLSDEEFCQVFGVTKEDFQKNPIWKQKQMKQQVNLF